MSKVELRQEWEARIADFRNSGQTARAWCTERGLNLHTLRYWLRKFPQSSSGRSESVKWLSINLDEHLKNENVAITLQVGDTSIEVRPGFNPTLLKQIVQTLQSC